MDRATGWAAKKDWSRVRWGGRRECILCELCSAVSSLPSLECVVGMTYHTIGAATYIRMSLHRIYVDAVQRACPSLLVIMSMRNRLSAFIKFGKKKKNGAVTSASPQPTASVSIPATSSTPVRMLII
jgi:hypothetical protein